MLIFVWALITFRPQWRSFGFTRAMLTDLLSFTIGFLCLLQTLCWAVRISITTSYSISVKILYSSRSVRCLLSHVIVEFPNTCSRHMYALSTHFSALLEHLSLIILVVRRKKKTNSNESTRSRTQRWNRKHFERQNIISDYILCFSFVLELLFAAILLLVDDTEASTVKESLLGIGFSDGPWFFLRSSLKLVAYCWRSRNIQLFTTDIRNIASSLTRNGKEC